MKKVFSLALILICLVSLLVLQLWLPPKTKPTSPQVLSTQKQTSHWLLLHRKSNQEFLYHGLPGDKSQSTLLKTFQVKAGIPNQRPTPLPQLLGQGYWLIQDKFETPDNPETAPYFLQLNIPYTEEFPYGPEPYLECNGQCDWVLPGSFGLHGVGGNLDKLTDEGSSGCIRHSDEDITYLYNLLDPKSEEIRYYIEDI